MISTFPTVFRLFVILMLSGCAVITASAQGKERKSLCNNYSDGSRQHFCETREQSIPSSGGTINVDGKKNGGIRVSGWKKNEVLVRAGVQAWESTEDEAREMFKQIRIETGSGRIFEKAAFNNNNWPVSYEIFVPTILTSPLKPITAA